MGGFPIFILPNLPNSPLYYILLRLFYFLGLQRRKQSYASENAHPTLRFLTFLKRSLGVTNALLVIIRACKKRHADGKARGVSVE
jgi:hypothetical protein